MRSMFSNKKRIAENYLLKYKYLKKLQGKQERVYLSAAKVDGMPHGSNISNPTERLALQETLSEKDLAWLAVLDEYYQKSDERRKLIIDCRNQAEEHCKSGRGRPGWTDYVGQSYCEYMAEVKHIELMMPHRNTLNMWWNTIVSDVVILAMTKNLL